LSDENRLVAIGASYVEEHAETVSIYGEDGSLQARFNGMDIFSAEELEVAAQSYVRVNACASEPWICPTGTPRILRNTEILAVDDLMGDVVYFDMSTGVIEREDGFMECRARLPAE
jgi:hypothetical protein